MTNQLYEALLRISQIDVGSPPDYARAFNDARVIVQNELSRIASARSLAEVSNTDGRHRVSTPFDAGSSPAGRASTSDEPKATQYFVYMPCERHKGMTFTGQATYQPPIPALCPGCEAEKKVATMKSGESR